MQLTPWMVLLVLLWVSSASMVHAGINVWTSIGPGGGPVFVLANEISPQQAAGYQTPKTLKPRSEASFGESDPQRFNGGCQPKRIQHIGAQFGANAAHCPAHGINGGGHIGEPFAPH